MLGRDRVTGNTSQHDLQTTWLITGVDRKRKEKKRQCSVFGSVQLPLAVGGMNGGWRCYN